MPDRLYLFIEDKTSNQVATLLEREDAAPLYEARCWEDIAELQQKCQVYVIINSQITNHAFAEIPVRNEQKARLAIPFALEESLAEDIDDLHFAINNQLYQDGKYLVSIINKERFDGIILLLRNWEIQASAIIPDLFALPELSDQTSIAITTNTALIRNAQVQGAMPASLLAPCLKQSIQAMTVHTFEDSDPQMLACLEDYPTVSIEHHPELFHHFVAKHLPQQTHIDLQQAAYRSSHSSSKTLRLWQTVAGLTALWLVILFAGHSTEYFYLKKKSTQLKKAVMAIYQDFFPGATSLVSPKFRIQRQLQSNQGPQGEKDFLILLLKSSPIIRQFDALKVNNLNYKDNKLTLQLLTENVQTLQSLQKKLRSVNLKVKQTGASSLGKKVTASIEIQL